MSIRILLALVALAGLTFAVACGGGDDNGDDGSKPANGEPGGNALGVLGPDSPTVSVSSPSVEVGSEGDAVVEVVYDLTPSIGAWTIDVKFDKDIVSVAECDPVLETAVCNPAYEEDTVRFAGASLGITGETVFGRITFRCDEAGESALVVTVETLADGTIGDPRLLVSHIEDGTITCG